MGDYTMIQIDIFIIFNAVSYFCIFWFLHLSLFRKIVPEKIILGLVSVYLITGFLGTLLSLLLFMQILNFNGIENMYLLLLTMGIIQFIFSLLVCVYILGIFGVIESSVRIKLLQLVAETKNDGLTKKDIYNRYDKKSILHKRIARMQNSGDLMFKDGKYYLSKRWSPLLIMVYFSNFINRLYL